MMPTCAADRLGRLSGTGWAVGYVGGLVCLVIVLGFLAANPQTGKTILGVAPLFGLAPATREGDRASGRSPRYGTSSSSCPCFSSRRTTRARGRAAAVGPAWDHRRHAAPPVASPTRRVPARQHDLYRRHGRRSPCSARSTRPASSAGARSSSACSASCSSSRRLRRLPRRPARRPARPEAGDPREPGAADRSPRSRSCRSTRPHPVRHPRGAAGAGRILVRHGGEHLRRHRRADRDRRRAAAGGEPHAPGPARAARTG